MEPQFLENYSLSEEDKRTFLRLYEKSLYYSDGDGHLRKVPDEVFTDILEKWDIFPEELKEKASLPAIAKYKRQSDYTEYGELRAKEFGRAQINYNEDYFPSEDEYRSMCDQLYSLPDNKEAVYNFLHEHSMLNLNYVPNKIRLLDDYVADKFNISFQEKKLWLEDKNIKYEDLVGFGDPQRNFSHNNYLKSVDTLMAVLANDADGASHFRKMYQYHNLLEAVEYSDYDEYNWVCHGYDDDDYDEDNYTHDELIEYDDEEDEEDLNEEIDEQLRERESRAMSEDIVAYLDKKHNFDINPPRNSRETPLVALYLQNEEEVSKTAYALCRVFGKQADRFVKRFLETTEKQPEQEITYYPIEEDNRFKDKITPAEQFEDDFEFFSEQEFNMKNKINTARLKIWAMQSQKMKDEQKKFEADDSENYAFYSYQKKRMCSPETQEMLLELLNVLPRDFREDKYVSFGKFMQKSFFYKAENGEMRVRPTEEIKKIIRVWPQLTQEQENMKYSDILKLAQTDGYLNSRAQEFETEAKLRKLPKQLFDVAQSAYLRGLDTPRTITDNYSTQSGEFTLRLMDIADPSIMFVGEGFSCQTITKAGVYPALSSVQDPFSRAMVVERDDHVVGLAWIWTTEEEKYGKKYKSMCVDNLELADFVSYGTDLSQIMSGLSQLSMQIADAEDFRRVTLGAKATHYSPERYFQMTEALNAPKAYMEQTPIPGIKEKINYGDSAKQVLIYENPLARPLGRDMEVFVVHRDAYTNTEDEEKGALAVGDRAYPWKAEFREKNTDSQFMLLKNKKNEVLGYALYSDVDHHIHDVAVDPAYQKYSKHLLFKLLNHMKEKSGQNWEAECRKSTSLALLEKMEERGVIRLKRPENNFIVIQGERLSKVIIEFNDSVAQKQKTASVKEQITR